MADNTRFPILYKRTSTGATQQWQQEVEDGKYRTISGQKDGKLVVSQWTECLGKNIGKANETTPEQQAIKEVEANYKKKIDQKGYFENIEDIDEQKFFKPMLAKDYDGKVKFPVFTQPKLDGIRCIISENGMFTRNGKSVVSCIHILEELKPLFDSYKNNKPFFESLGFDVSENKLILDGELYNHELKHDFNKIVSLSKKEKPTQEELQESKELIQFHLYDWPDNNRTLSFAARKNTIDFLNSQNNFKYIKIVRTEKVDNVEELDKLYEEFLDDGYEGQMIRLDLPYENKRSKSLLKRKPDDSDEFELVDIQSGIGNWQGIAKTATLKLADGREFGAGIKGSQERNRQILLDKDKYIGTKTTVEYIGFTPDGKPRFGRVKEFNRSDK